MNCASFLNNLRVIARSEIRADGQPNIAVDSYFVYSLKPADESLIENRTFRRVMDSMKRSADSANPILFTPLKEKTPQMEKVDRIFQWAGISKEGYEEIYTAIGNIEKVDDINAAWKKLGSRCSLESFKKIMRGEYNKENLHFLLSAIYAGCSFQMGTVAYREVQEFIKKHMEGVDSTCRDLVLLTLAFRFILGLNIPSNVDCLSNMKIKNARGLSFFIKEITGLLGSLKPLLESVGFHKFYVQYSQKLAGICEEESFSFEVGFKDMEAIELASYKCINPGAYESELMNSVVVHFPLKYFYELKKSMEALEQQCRKTFSPEFMLKGGGWIDKAIKEKYISTVCHHHFHRYEYLFFYFLSGSTPIGKRLREMIIGGDFSRNDFEELVLAGGGFCDPFEIENDFLIDTVVPNYRMFQVFREK